MIYEITSKADLSSVTLLVRFPEEDLDEKALYTIQADAPPFLIPFRHRIIDGQVECAYQLGNYSKLQYWFGARSPEEYIGFWEQVLQPLMDCGDWFLKVFSFVLDPKYLYTDRSGERVLYLYVPSREDCCTPEELRSMVEELSKRNTVTDSQLENKVLRAIMEGFQPKNFLHMLRDSRLKVAPVPGSAAVSPLPPTPTPAPVERPACEPVPVPAAVPTPQPQQPPKAGGDGDIVIDLSGGEAKGAEKKSGGLFGRKSEKKKEESSLKKSGLFGGKKEKEKKPKGQKEIVLGAAAREPFPAQQMPSAPRMRVQDAPVWTPPQVENEETQLEEAAGGTRLRLVGDPALPREIPVNISQGQAFTIGRFDVSIGHQQSSFEFDKRTRAVSRHHAAIERQADGSYIIVDLVSSAGTFLDGQRLTANIPYQLVNGMRISFGTSGADYIWEE